MHPGPQGAVALAWLSPVDGAIAIRGRVADAHTGGDGIGWQVAHLPTLDSRTLSSSWAKPAGNSTPLGGCATRSRIGTGKSRAASPSPRESRRTPASTGAASPKIWAMKCHASSLIFSAGNKSRRPMPAAGRTGRLAHGSVESAHARVMANRLWQWHFGRGLVKTANDFGSRSAPRRIPPLLDYLASQFIKSGWSVAAIDRLIVNRATYRQESTGAADDFYVGFAGAASWPKSCATRCWSPAASLIARPARRIRSRLNRPGRSRSMARSPRNTIR